MIKAVLLRRYKRFLADVTLEDGSECTVHCPNPGAMTGAKDAGMTVYLTPAKNPKAKLPYRWGIVDTGTALVGIDASRANVIMADALRERLITAFADYQDVKSEVKIDAKTRLDFCLSMGKNETERLYLEVKSASLSTEHRVAAFPDSVTLRGQKHLKCLMDLVKQGEKAALFFVVQRNDCDNFRLAAEIDPHYAQLCLEAYAAGVEVQAWGCTIEPENNKIAFDKQLVWLDKPL